MFGRGIPRIDDEFLTKVIFSIELKKGPLPKVQGNLDGEGLRKASVDFRMSLVIDPAVADDGRHVGELKYQAVGSGVAVA